MLYCYNNYWASTNNTTVKNAFIADLQTCGYDTSALVAPATSTPSTEVSEVTNEDEQLEESVTETTSSINESKSVSDNKASEVTEEKKSINESTSEENTSVEDVNDEVKEEWIETARVEATCVKEGYIEYTNSVTGETKTEELSIIDHTPGEKETIIAPILFSKGTSVIRCTVCDEVLETIEEPALFPAWGYVVAIIVILGIAGVIAFKIVKK